MVLISVSKMVNDTVLISRNFCKMQKVTLSFFVSVCLSVCYNSAITGRIFMKFDIENFSKTCGENSIFF